MKVLEALIEQYGDLEIGKHRWGYLGYFCGPVEDDTWEGSGHGFTLQEAVLNFEMISQDKVHRVPAEKFECKEEELCE